jgi:hypothetical protein
VESTNHSFRSSASPPNASPDLAAFERAYVNFLQSLQSFASGSDLQDQLSQSYAEYHRALGSGVPDEQAQRAAAEAYARHVALLQRALSPEHMRRRTGDALLEYLQAVKAAWAVIDERAVPPAALAAIGQSFMAVATTAAGVIGPAGLTPAAAPSLASR